MNRGTRFIRNVKKIKNLELFPVELKPVPVSEAISWAITEAQNDMPHKQLNVTIENRLGHMLVMADEYLTDVFYELLHNALRFDRCRRVDVDMIAGLTDDNQMVRIQIADRATGISDETKKILFMRKSLIKTDRRGTGLGLTLVKHIITRYGGNIYARDRVPGNYREGTVFVLEIPRAVPLE